MFKKITRLYRLFWARFTSPLPQTVSEFYRFANDILDLYDLPKKQSTIRAIGIMVQQLGPTVTHAPKKYFGMAARKSIANEVVFDVIDTMIKAKKAAESKIQSDPDLQHAVAEAMNTCGETEALS